jgi:Mn-dependent DtxR family transcriptional regulator
MKSSEFYTFRGYEIIDREKNVLTPSMEDYLEMIYRMCLEDSNIRMNILAKHLNVRTSSSTKIVQKLAKIGLVNYEPYSLISLTDKGKEVGKFLYERHIIIEKFLFLIGVENTTLKDTELIEHYVSPNLLKKFNQLNRFFMDNKGVLDKYNSYIKTNMENKMSADNQYKPAD